MRTRRPSEKWERLRHHALQVPRLLPQEQLPPDQSSLPSRSCVPATSLASRVDLLPRVQKQTTSIPCQPAGQPLRIRTVDGLKPSDNNLLSRRDSRRL